RSTVGGGWPCSRMLTPHPDATNGALRHEARGGDYWFDCGAGAGLSKGVTPPARWKCLHPIHRSAAHALWFPRVSKKRTQRKETTMGANADAVKSGWDAFAEGDLDTAVATTSDSAKIVIPESLPWGGTYTGPEGIKE